MTPTIELGHWPFQNVPTLSTVTKSFKEFQFQPLKTVENKDHIFYIFQPKIPSQIFNFFANEHLSILPHISTISASWSSSSLFPKKKKKMKKKPFPVIFG